MNLPQHSTEPKAEAPATASPLSEIRQMVQACLQCGTCSASCPNLFAMDITPRQMWRMIVLDMPERIFESRTYWLCAGCYTCTLRCPRGLPLTRAMQALKRIAVKENWPHAQKYGAFYAAFMDSVERFGRVRESDMMMRYFVAMKNPVLPFKYASLGLKLMRKGKMHLTVPFAKGPGKLKPLFDAVRQMEMQP